MNSHLLANQQTLIYISHNIDEALLIADKIIIFSESGTISSILDIPMNKAKR
jgi:ABC-type nitrate/sulfonate/bicarbonate transport system ATPase subunit